MDFNTLCAILFNPFSCVAWIYLFMFAVSWWDSKKKQNN